MSARLVALMLQRTAVVGLCGVTIFVILSIIQTTVPAVHVVYLSVTLKQERTFCLLGVEKTFMTKSDTLDHAVYYDCTAEDIFSRINLFHRYKRCLENPLSMCQGTVLPS